MRESDDPASAHPAAQDGRSSTVSAASAHDSVGQRGEVEGTESAMPTSSTSPMVVPSRVPWVPDDYTHAHAHAHAHGPTMQTGTTGVQAPSPLAGRTALRALWSRIAGSWPWRTRGFWLGALAIGLAMYAQKLVWVDRAVLESIRWYALAILLMILAWAGTYRNRSCLSISVPADRGESHRNGGAVNGPTTTLPVRPASPEANKTPTAGRSIWIRKLRRAWRWIRERSWPRYVVAFIALALNIYCAGLLRQDYYSAVGGYGWLFSLLLLVFAFVGERPPIVREIDDPQDDVVHRTDLRLPVRLEVLIVAAIFVVALALRLYRLGDITTGMHGDEGETGMEGIKILEGNPVSPFMTGWFSHPNFSFWSVAITMKLFGADLFGLRLFSALLGALMIIPFYSLVRLWFGVRAAIIATVLLAVMDVSLYFGRLGLNNITTPFFLVTGFYFLFKGLLTRRTIYFVLSAYAHMLTMYFYFGGRLTPILIGSVLAYIFLLMPLMRTPGEYWTIRRSDPTVGRLQAMAQAVRRQARVVLGYFGQVLIFVVAAVCMASPWYVYYVDHTAELEARPNDKLIFNNEARMAQQYGATHDPLYIGLRMPRPDDVYPFLPVVFEKTQLSAMLTQDGFWARVLWGQTTTTLSVLTYRADASSFYTFTGEPAAKPIEAALIVLGIAWALWRWRDTRMAVLSMWFWSAVLAGGTLTIDAPYVPRMVGMVPTLAVFAAIPLNKLVAEFVAAVSGLSAVPFRRRVLRFAGQVLSGFAVAGVLVYLSVQNYQDYFHRYIAAWPYPEVTGQAYFVRQMNQKVMAEGRPKPFYYNLGMHFIYWGHGDNRFLNHGTPGTDMVNPANELPIINNEGRDVIFMVWGLNAHYLPAIKAFYPDGEQGDFIYGPDGRGPHLFTYYRVTKEQIEARRKSMVTYTPANGPAIQREEPALSTTQPPPEGLVYPVQATWSGNLVAPQFGYYRFRLSGQAGATLQIDGTTVLTVTEAAQPAEAELLLARGPHAVRVSGNLPDESARVDLQWSAGTPTFTDIAPKYLWLGPGRAFYGEIRPFNNNDLLAPDDQAAQAPIIMARVDGFLGFRDSPSAMGGGVLFGKWTGTLNITQPGRYLFEVYSNGDSVVLIDGTLVVNNIRGGAEPHAATAEIELAPGDHLYELRYNFAGGVGYLEAFWTPPGEQKQLLGPNNASAQGGIVDPNLAIAPPPVQLESPAPPARLTPDTVIGDAAGLKEPRGLAVDRDGAVYVGDRGNHRIVVFGADGNMLRSWGRPPTAGEENNPQGDQLVEINDVAVGPDGRVYVLDASSRVVVFDRDGRFLRSLGVGVLDLYGANGIAVGPDGSVLVADTGHSRVLKLPPIPADPGQPFDPAQVVPITGGNQPGTNFEQPVDVLVDPTGSGYYYAIDLRSRLVQIDPGGNITAQWRVEIGVADGGSRLSISPDGVKVYMSDPDRQRVAVINTTTGNINYFGEPGGAAGQFGSPSGIATGPDGRVYVLDRVNANVQVFTVND